MNNIAVLTIIFITSIVFTGCSTMNVDTVDREHSLSNVCIEDNPKVIVAEFTGVIEDIFQEHGITTEIYNRGGMPEHCSIKMTYTATRGWDFTPFLKHAELRLYKNKKKIGYAEYHLTGGGGLDLSKWASVKSKMTPVVNKLLEQYK